jgi:glycosyltransferase involved in cell wall biosynthesis
MARGQWWSMQSPLRFIFKPLHTSIVAAELAVERALDALQPRRTPHDHSLVAENLTAIIKTIERPKVVRRLIASIKRRYPELKIIVVDDSRQPIKLEGVQVLELPYDSGISAGRNAGLKQVGTPYVLIADDDYVFYRHTDLDAILALMEQHAQIDIMGGEQIDLPWFGKIDYQHGWYQPGFYHHRLRLVFSTSAPARLPAGTSIGDLTVRDKVPNFFIARTERLRSVGWDPNLKRLDHLDFFARASGILTTASSVNLKFLHARTPFDRVYMQHRLDEANDLAFLKMKYDKPQ